MGLHSGVTIIPSLENIYSPYYDIFYKTEIENYLTCVGPFSAEYIQINNNSDLYFYTMVESDFKIYFELRNRETGEIALTKTYNVHLSMNAGNIDSDDNNGSITGGIINEGTDDEEIMTPENDNNFSGLFEGINESSSMKDIVNSAKGTFETFKVAFSILPDFIWAIISGTLLVIIVLRVLGR